jgi:hypothetical protein
MGIERLLFLIAATATLGYVAIKKRRVDWFSVAAAAAAIYFAPGFGGFVTDPDLRRSHEVVGHTYLVFCLVFMSIGIGAIYEDFAPQRVKKEFRRISVASDDRAVANVVLIIAIVSLVLSVAQMGDLVWASEKEVSMSTHGRWLIAYEFSVCFAFLTYFASGARTASVIAGLLILPTIFFGYRTAAVMTFVAAMMIQLRGMERVALIRKWPIIVLVAATLYGAVFFKTIQFGIKFGLETGQWSVLLNTLDTENLYQDALFNSEPFIVQNTLNEVVKSSFSVGVEQLESLAAVFVPFGNELGMSGKGFNDYFQPALFSDVDYGLAANIWAQAYSLGSLSTVLIFCLVFVGVTRKINAIYARASGHGLAGIALAGAYWCFYIHRNDLLYEALLLRRVLMVFVIGWFVSRGLAWRRTWNAGTRNLTVPPHWSGDGVHAATPRRQP